MKRYVMLFVAIISILIGCKEKEKEYGTLVGKIYYSATLIPVSGVTVSGGGKSSTSSSDGSYILVDIEIGTYNFMASKEGYDNFSFEYSIVSWQENYKDVEMTSSLYTKKIFGTVINPANNPYSEVTVVVLNPDLSESNLKSETSTNGYYQIPMVPQGNRRILFKSSELRADLDIFLANYDYPLDYKLNFYSFSLNGYIYYMSPKDLSNNTYWGPAITTVATSEDDGKTNTEKIISKLGLNNGHEYAAQLCDDFVSFGFDDWFLPSINEMDAIPNKYLESPYDYGFTYILYSIGVDQEQHYWTSTELNYAEAEYKFIGGGNTGDDYKIWERSVRAMRRESSYK